MDEHKECKHAFLSCLLCCYREFQFTQVSSLPAYTYVTEFQCRNFTLLKNGESDSNHIQQNHLNFQLTSACLYQHPYHVRNSLCPHNTPHPSTSSSKLLLMLPVCVWNNMYVSVGKPKCRCRKNEPTTLH